MKKLLFALLLIGGISLHAQSQKLVLLIHKYYIRTMPLLLKLSKIYKFFNKIGLDLETV